MNEQEQAAGHDHLQKAAEVATEAQAQTSTLQQPATPAFPSATAQDGGDEKKLSDGRSFMVEVGTGDTAIKANQMMDGDQNLFMVCCMQQVVKIEGSLVPLDELRSMKLGDFIKIQTEFAVVNF